ncbi:MAG: hypothetical protein KDM81_05235 [Verrucomicrobiae bacterium]|nr:hypothetical protein [Verrucomicrobiae bacterium]
MTTHPRITLVPCWSRVERATEVLFLSMVLVVANGCGFYTMNMHKAPERWVTVLDADTGAPVAGVPLVYLDTEKPYFIVSSLVESGHYVSGPDGRAHVPRNVRLETAHESNYLIDSIRHPNPPKNAEVYYVRTWESYEELVKSPKPIN